VIQRFLDWLDAQPTQRRRLYSVLLSITLLTLPCYATGAGLLFLLDSPSPESAPSTESRDPFSSTGDATQAMPTVTGPSDSDVDRSPQPATEPPDPGIPPLEPGTAEPTVVLRSPAVTGTEASPRLRDVPTLNTAVPSPAILPLPTEAPARWVTVRPGDTGTLEPPTSTP